MLHNVSKYHDDTNQSLLTNALDDQSFNGSGAKAFMLMHSAILLALDRSKA
jgi:hypothetical protein